MLGILNDLEIPVSKEYQTYLLSLHKARQKQLEKWRRTKKKTYLKKLNDAVILIDELEQSYSAGV